MSILRTGRALGIMKSLVISLNGLGNGRQGRFDLLPGRRREMQLIHGRVEKSERLLRWGVSVGGIARVLLGGPDERLHLQVLGAERLQRSQCRGGAERQDQFRGEKHPVGFARQRLDQRRDRFAWQGVRDQRLERALHFQR